MIQSVEFYRTHPIEWMELFFGTRYWWAQREIAEAISNHDLVSVKSGHAIGKSFISSSIVLWFLFNHPEPCLVLTTAPTFRQVKNILWAEINGLHARLKDKISVVGEIFQTELRFTPLHRGIGFSADDPDAVVGLHAKNMLTIFDEASGVNREIYEAMSSLTSAKGNKILLIGNPTEPNTYFHWTHEGKVPGYHRITVSSTQSPNVKLREDGSGLYDDIDPVPFPGLCSAQWINQAIQTHGRHSNYCKARVFGEFPSIAIDQLIDGKYVALAAMKGAQLRGLLQRLTELKEIVRSEDLKTIRGY